MGARISTNFAALLANAIKAQVESEAYCIRLYAAPRRATPQDAVGAATLLVTITAGGLGLTWEAAVDQLLSKNVSEVWEATNVANGTAVWGCHSPVSDTGLASSSIYRTDFDVGLWTDGVLPDLKMSSNVLVSGEVTRINQATYTVIESVSDL